MNNSSIAISKIQYAINRLKKRQDSSAPNIAAGIGIAVDELEQTLQEERMRQQVPRTISTTNLKGLNHG